MNRGFAILAVPVAMLALVSTLVAQPASAVDRGSPESVARAYAEATQRHDVAAMVALLHPALLDRFKARLLPQIHDVDTKTESDWWNVDSTMFAALSPADFARRILDSSMAFTSLEEVAVSRPETDTALTIDTAAGLSSGRSGSPRFIYETSSLGHILLGSDTAIVVLRTMSHLLSGASKIDSTDLGVHLDALLLLRDQDGWGVGQSEALESIITSIYYKSLATGRAVDTARPVAVRRHRLTIDNTTPEGACRGILQVMSEGTADDYVAVLAPSFLDSLKARALPMIEYGMKHARGSERRMFLKSLGNRSIKSLRAMDSKAFATLLYARVLPNIERGDTTLGAPLGHLMEGTERAYVVYRDVPPSGRKWLDDPTTFDVMQVRREGGLWWFTFPSDASSLGGGGY